MSEVLEAQGVGDVLEFCRQIGANRRDRENDDDRDEAGDETVLDGGDAFFIAEKRRLSSDDVLKHSEVPFLLPPTVPVLGTCNVAINQRSHWLSGCRRNSTTRKKTRNASQW